MKQKTIGIDARFFGEAGPGRYVKNIVQHLEQVDSQNKYLVFLRLKGFAAYNPKNKNFIKVLAEHPWYSWNEQIFFLLRLLKYKLDLFYVPHFNVPVLYPKKLVTAIPDIIMHTYSTEKGTTLPLWYFKVKKFVYRAVLWWAVVRSKKVIVPSQVTMDDFLNLFPGVSKEKYVLAKEGVDPEYIESDLASEEVMRELGIESPFLLYVGSTYEHKNVTKLVDAFKILIEKHGFGGQLVLVGKKDKFSQRVLEKITSANLQDRVLMPGLKRYIKDEEVVALRKEAALYVFPSLMEGFSLTPMESQTAGLACVISDIPIHREIYGDSVFYFDPRDSEDMAEKINLCLKDESLREDLIKKGFEQYKKYNWKETAQKTLEVFNSVL